MPHAPALLSYRRKKYHDRCDSGGISALASTLSVSRHGLARQDSVGQPTDRRDLEASSSIILPLSSVVCDAIVSVSGAVNLGAMGATGDLNTNIMLTIFLHPILLCDAIIFVSGVAPTNFVQTDMFLSNHCSQVAYDAPQFIANFWNFDRPSFRNSTARRAF